MDSIQAFSTSTFYPRLGVVVGVTFVGLGHGQEVWSGQNEALGGGGGGGGGCYIQNYGSHTPFNVP